MKNDQQEAVATEVQVHIIELQDVELAGIGGGVGEVVIA